MKKLVIALLIALLIGCDEAAVMMTAPTRVALMTSPATAIAAMSTPRPTATTIQLAPAIERPPLDLSQFPNQNVAITEITHSAENGDVTWRTLFRCGAGGWIEVYREENHHPQWWYEDYIAPRRSYIDGSEMVVVTRYDVQRVTWECER